MTSLHSQKVQRSRGFTLVELLVVVTIIGVLASVALMALAGATEQARVDRTNAEITKLNELIMDRYDGYRVRPLAMRPEVLAAKIKQDTAGATDLNPTIARNRALLRYYIVMEQMRMELPERIADLRQRAVVLSRQNSVNPTQFIPLEPTLWKTYRRKAKALVDKKFGVNSHWDNNNDTDPNYVPNRWTTDNSNAECLYLIISSLRDEETTGLDYFTQNEIGDTDGDGMPEILDAWGQPIRFLRWAPGFCSVSNPPNIPYPAPTSRQTGNATTQHDPFDPLKLYPTNYAIYPLIYSGGPDKRVGINGGNVDYATLATPSFPNNPYHTVQTGFTGEAIGACVLESPDTGEYWHDNITNHINVAR